MLIFHYLCLSAVLVNRSISAQAERRMSRRLAHSRGRKLVLFQGVFLDVIEYSTRPVMNDDTVEVAWV